MAQIMGHLFAISAFLAPALVSAVPWNGPRATGNGGAEVVGWSPAPTSPPLLYRGMDHIFQRQETRGDNTCGYEHDDPSNTFSCNNDAFVCATNSVYGVFGCCNPNSIDACVIRTTCVPSSEATSCTGACESNGYVALCTETSAPECYNILYNFGTTTMIEWGCSAVQTTVLVDYSTSGESLGSDTSQIEVPISTRVVTVSPVESDSSSADDSSSVTSIGSSTAGGNNNSNKGSSTNVGAIAGGVVGGVAALAIIVAGIIFLLMRRKKKSKAAAAAAGPAAAGGYQPPPMTGPQGPHSPPAQAAYPQGAYPQQGYGQQAAYDPAGQQATAGYYQPQDPSKSPLPQDYKYNYNAPMTEAPPPAAGAAELGDASQPYSQPSSPPPGAPAQHDTIQQLDSTTVQPAGQTSPKPVIHEIGS